MKNDKRMIRQEKMAKILYELGMDIDVVSKVSGVSKEKINKFNKEDNNFKKVCKK